MTKTLRANFPQVNNVFRSNDSTKGDCAELEEDICHRDRQKISDEPQIDFYKVLMYNADSDAECFPISHTKNKKKKMHKD